MNSSPNNQDWDCLPQREQAIAWKLLPLSHAQNRWLKKSPFEASRTDL